MIERILSRKIQEDLAFYPGVVILGPRQVGKTTLARNQLSFGEKEVVIIDLEKPSDLNKLSDAERFFETNKDKLVIIDEVQRRPDLFPIIRSAIDEHRVPSRFILLGSSSDEIILKSTESLAGRVAYHELHPLSIAELPSQSINNLFIYGGYPEAYIASSNPKQSMGWISNLVRSHIQRELGMKSLNISSQEMETLLRILASINGQTINYSELSKLMQVSAQTVKKYIHFLENAYLVRTILPYHVNNMKRLVKSPKIYIRDSGILSYLMQWETQDDLEGDYHKGFAWESFVLQQICALLSPEVTINFYKTQAGSEIDFVLLKGPKPTVSFEVKYSNSPKLTKSSTEAMKDLKAKHNFIITPSSDRYMLNEHTEVIPLAYLPSLLSNLNLTY